MKRKTIFIAIAAMAFIAFSCAREELSIPAGEVTETEEIGTRSDNPYPPDGFHCHNCGFWTEGGICVGCDTKYIKCDICGGFAPGSGFVCTNCRNGGTPPCDWVDDDPDPRPKP